MNPSTDTIEEIGAIAAIGPPGQAPASKYERLIARARAVPPAATRADSVRSRMASCAAAVLYAHSRRRSTALPAA